MTASIDLLDLSIAHVSLLLRRREVTSVELVDAALDRASRTQPVLNAFVEIEADAARKRAQFADDELDRGVWRGPLHGIPLAHKDCFERIGKPMSLGSRVSDQVPGQRTAAAIERLEAAGAVTIGALSLSEMVANPTGQNPHFGDCCNAFDPSRISGGSSSGSGPAVASGSVFASLGSDTGGSIRLPASANGLFGLKPTYGRVPRFGCFPRAFSLDCIGPLARTPEDCAILLRAVAGNDRRDPSCLDAPVPDYASQLEGQDFTTRVAILDDLGDIDAEVASMFDRFSRSVGTLFGPPEHASNAGLKDCYTMGDVISKVEAATLHGNWMRERGDRYSQAVFSRTEPGLHIPAVRYLEALAVRAKMLRKFLGEAMGGTDVLLCPTMPVTVPTREDADMEKQGRVFGVVSQLSRLTRPFNYLGLPALTMPIGLDRHGLPVGVQIIGRPLSESRLLSFAHRMSREIAWKLMPSHLVDRCTGGIGVTLDSGV